MGICKSTYKETVDPAAGGGIARFCQINVAGSCRLGMQYRLRGKQRNFEDQLTSWVFSPLRYMGPKQAWDACVMLLGLPSHGRDLDSEPTRVCIRFWPHFRRDDGMGRRFVEPDVHIVAWNGDSLLATILVETKWDSALGRNQLIDQWRFITADDLDSAEVRSRSTHALLSRRPLQDADSIEEQKEIARNENIEWGDRLIVLSWYEVTARLVGSLSGNRSVEVWRRDLIALFELHGIIAFGGFHCNRFAPVDLVQWQFEGYTEPNLLEIKLLDWSLDRENVT